MNTKKYLVAICALICGLLAPLPIAAQTPAPQKQTPPAGGQPKPFNVPKRETLTLPNGLRVSLVPYGDVPKVSIQAVIRAGNVNETAEQIWLADMTAEMLKEGTTETSAEQIAQQAALMGGSLGVAVAPDQTNVGIDVLSERGPDAVLLLAGVIRRPSLPASEVARFKTNYLRRLNVARAQPGSLATERFHKLLYPNHAYGRIFPTEAMINNYTIDDFKKFYAANYGAARTHIYVAGKFDAAAMKRALTQGFGEWASGTPPLMNVPQPVAARVIHLIDRPGAPQSTINLGLPVVAPGNRDYLPLLVTNSLLGGSFASRITSNIREAKGYTYSPFSQLSVRYRDAYWMQVADVTTAVTGPSLKEIFYEIDRLQKEPPSAAELEGIQNYMAGVFVLRNSTRQGLIGQLAFIDLHGLDEKYIADYVRNVLAVTPPDVQRIARDYLKADKMTIVVVGDKEKIAQQVGEFGEVMN
ncbi:MAG: insulinase family protein [Pyrinomonadaceae bacterium]|nr:insulinase family protein [Pyrinomonadaceae bacterium]